MPRPAVPYPMTATFLPLSCAPVAPMTAAAVDCPVPMGVSIVFLSGLSTSDRTGTASGEPAAASASTVWVPLRECTVAPTNSAAASGRSPQATRRAELSMSN